MSEAALPNGRAEAPRGALPALSLTALGVVFGDIGTSPLYTLKTVLDATGAHPSRIAVLGSLSLIVWTLLIITTVKYVALAMQIDNDGEGGILALMALLGVKRRQRRTIVLVGLFGAALIYGDGAITPAISVLSALEGLDIMIPGFERFVVPLAVLILLVLFAVQPQGTALIGRVFGPVMALWFAVIALLGIYGITLHPAVLAALDPIYGLRFLFSGGLVAFAVLGGVFLCVTGAEALYADMGHFGARPIRAAWTMLVLPSLVLSYAGQAALVLSGAPTGDNIFYRLCPPMLLPALILLATVATIIASQSIITGAFSMTRQAIQLGWMPRLTITQTSAAGYGQIYVGVVNWLLMFATVGLTIGFGKSDNLASAYGIAVSLTMLMTTVLLFIAMREVWQWSVALATTVAGALFVIDAAFVSANMLKLADGGYVPLILAGLIYCVMLTWHAGLVAIGQHAESVLKPLDVLDAAPRAWRHPTRARHRGLSYPYRTRCAAGAALVPENMPRRAEEGYHPHRKERAGALDLRKRASCDRAHRAQPLAPACPFRLHGAAGHPRTPRHCEDCRLHRRSRRHRLYHRPRNRGAPGRQEPPALAGRHALHFPPAQLRPCHGLSRPSGRPGFGDRSRDRGL